MIDVLDVLVPLEAKRQSVGRGTLFELVFKNREDRSKKVTVFWYIEVLLEQHHQKQKNG
jgi:hypothetical protein